MENQDIKYKTLEHWNIEYQNKEQYSTGTKNTRKLEPQNIEHRT